MKTWQRAAVAALLAVPTGILAQESPDDGDIEEIVVLGRSVSTTSTRVEVEREMLVDTASALKDIPGANVNRNGVITGIAQYRGMFGDRVAVGMDDLGMISGGPNAMDAPLSYMSPMITEELVVERGIAMRVTCAGVHRRLCRHTDGSRQLHGRRLAGVRDPWYALC